MVEIFAPNSFSEYWDHKKIFLAGSIEQGAASPWQKQAAAAFKKFDNVAILNPRRPDWDSTWKNVASDKNFRQQVEWELDGLQACDAVLMYYDPKTKSPISLLETGLFAFDDVLYVVCPDGFYRKGNVDIVCQRYHIRQYDSISEAIAAIIENHIH